jgi:ubiquinone/menaquinone biosynthesis C-methylase UbiE
MNIIKKILELIISLFFKVLFIFVPRKNTSKDLQKTIDLYKGDGFAELFAEIRTWDAPYEPINKIIKKNATILDLGCGDGTLSNYLAITSKRRRVYGIDINKERVDKAYKGLENTKFEKGDILKIKIIKPDVVILAHVLHHLPSKNEQINLLKKITKNLGKNKELIILEIDYKPFLKYLFTWLTDAITVPILFEGKLFNPNFFYRKSGEWKKILTDLGYDVHIKKIDKGMPFSHVLIYAKKLA